MPTTEPITVTFWGAARTVTGSMHLVEANGQRLLLDCGFYQGRRDESRQRNSTFPFKPSTIDAVVLSHAHIDHCGNLPHLVRNGFNGPIFCTPATRDLLAIMLNDSAKIQMEDSEFLNRKRVKGEPPVEPLYTDKDVRRMMRQVQSVPYDRPQEVGKSIVAQFTEAGHLLGSAMVHLRINAAHRDRSITFTGDLGRAGLPILRDPAPIPPAELVICESTYGGRNHPGVELLADELCSAVKKVMRDGGKILIPAFSLGRTQTVVYFLHQLINEGKLEKLPIFVDSPLATRATAVFRMHSECFDEETSELLFRDPDLFGEKLVRYTEDVRESKALNDRTDPCIIIAASGMCESGRILHHLKHNLPDPRTAVLIIGYQAPDTLGRRLVEKRREVRILGQMVECNAHIEVMNGFSGHAGRDDLLNFLTPLKGKCDKIRLVHGEPDQALALMKTLQERGFTDVAYPERGEKVTLD